MKISKLLISILFVLLLFGNTVSAFVLLTEEQALQEMFSDVDDIVIETKVANPEELAAMKEIMGGRLVLFQKGSDAKEIGDKTEYTFYFGIKDGKKVSVSIIEKQPGKWGPIEYIVNMNMEGEVLNLAVMSFVEKRGKPIAKRIFLKQFIGKTIKDKFLVKKDIRPISGATISSRSACFAVKKCVVLFEELYLNKAQA
jgi:Na+-translocating ferredoxin:NAD+ oxidoreductase RnfG subunit